MRNVYSVGQINSYIRRMFAEDFLLQELSVKGEVSNCKYHSSGHIYFTLKDSQGTISCVMFAGNRSGLSFRMAEGMQVIVQGTVDVYERDGKYQLYAKRISLAGEGALYERFQKLKQELAERGMFAEEYKQPIPKYIRILGVVTASTGAAVRDIINITKRRNPYVQILLYPAIVQGAEAADSIVRGIRKLTEAGVDVMIVGRGGGSIEDLWAFNEEKVAQAVFDCPVPVISAVGHETDTTIIDYVADLRAPTPSAAAELAVYDVHALEERIVSVKDTLTRQIMRKLQMEKAMLQTIGVRLKGSSPIGKIRDRRTLAMQLEEHLQHAMEGRLQRDRHRLALYIEQLRGLSPLDKLNQGYSYVADAKGRTVTDVNRVKEGDRLTVYVKNGRIDAAVTDVCPMEYQ